MPAAVAPIFFTRMERLEAKASHLRAQIRHHQSVRQYARQGQPYRPLGAVCGFREMQIATAAAARATAARGRHVGFDEALAALRAGG